MLYNHPGASVRNWALPLNLSYLRTIRDQFPPWDIDAYLPHETMEWCQNFFTRIGFVHTTNQPPEEARTSPFSDIYLQLRSALQDHIASGNAPKLSVLASPTAVEMLQVSNQSDVRLIDLETDPLPENEGSMP